MFIVKNLLSISCFILISLSFFAQSKKKEIVLLQHRFDSLNCALNESRKTNRQKVFDLKINLSDKDTDIIQLENQINSLNINIVELGNEIYERKQKDQLKQKKLEELLSILKTKSDSLIFLKSQTTKYNTIIVGNQCWMAENLNISYFRNGDPIPEAKTDEEWKYAIYDRQPAWCYYENDPKNGEIYGKLYNWYAVNDPRGLAPLGWHTASDNDWSKLTYNLVGEQYFTAAIKLKSDKGWNCRGECNYTYTNESGFSALPGGQRSQNGLFEEIGWQGSWWCSTPCGTNEAHCREMKYGSENDSGTGGIVFEVRNHRGNGYSVRCVKD
jgi:uncharacterized protein (TIGR02145 family)